MGAALRIPVLLETRDIATTAAFDRHLGAEGPGRVCLQHVDGLGAKLGRHLMLRENPEIAGTVLAGRFALGNRIGRRVVRVARRMTVAGGADDEKPGCADDQRTTNETHPSVFEPPLEMAMRPKPDLGNENARWPSAAGAARPPWPKAGPNPY